MKYRNLMLIDDDEDDQEIFISALNNISIAAKCDTFSEAQTALKKLVSKEINPEVIFLDLNMPIMSGQQFLMEIKKVEYLREIPIIIFSTSSHSATIQLTRDMGAHDFITKPDNLKDLVNILKPMIA